MGLEVCISSFYLVFLMSMVVKNILMFYAIQKAKDNYQHLIVLMIIFDVMLLFTLPLAIMMFRGVC